MPRTKRKIVRNEFGDTELKWVQVTKTGRKIPGQNKLKGGKAYEGFSHEDFKEWGKQGGRPLKWKSEAERKKAARLKKKIAENKPLNAKQSQFLSQLTNFSTYSHSNPRPGSWTYHSNRPATSTERVRKHRGQEIAGKQ